MCGEGRFRQGEKKKKKEVTSVDFILSMRGSFCIRLCSVSTLVLGSRDLGPLFANVAYAQNTAHAFFETRSWMHCIE